MKHTNHNNRVVQSVFPKNNGRIDIDPKFIARIIGGISDRDAPLLRSLLSSLHPADIADIIEQLSLEQRKILIYYVPDIIDTSVLIELETDTRSGLLPLFPVTKLAMAVSELESDDAALLVDELDEEKREQVLEAISHQDRHVVETSLSYDEESAGRLMQGEFIASPPFWTVEQISQYIRAYEGELPDLFFEIYIVDPRMKPVGSVVLSDLLKAKSKQKLSDIMQELPVLIKSDMDQEEVAYLFEKYHLVSAPVVDKTNRLIGMITVDDALEVIQEENTEDMLALAGVSESGLADNVFGTVKARLPWLLINLIAALFASFVIQFFEGSIAKLVALAILMPVVASLGGNAGTQALAVAVRTIANRDLTKSNARRIIGKEVLSAFVNGLFFSILIASISYLWFGNYQLSIVIAISMIINFLCAGLAGIYVPLILHRLGADPAVASSVFVSTVTDVVGFFVFLGLATLILF